MAKRGGVFRKVGSVNLGRSAFDLSHRKLLTCDMGQLIPVTNLMAIPGDTFIIRNELVVRLQPTFAPVLHEINAYVHWFYVPFRILWNLWEDYITGGRDGRASPELPLNPNLDNVAPGLWPEWLRNYGSKGSLMDYIYGVTDVLSAPSVGSSPSDFPLRAYNKIYNDYYRDENFIDEVSLLNPTILLRAWEKDYFTSALPQQQRGDAPAFPLSGNAYAVFDGQANNQDPAPGYQLSMVPVGSPGNPPVLAVGSQGGNFVQWLQQNHIPMSNVATFDVSDMRLAFQIQKYLERNMRAGARYTEWLRARFGVAPRDERLDRAEYIGGSKSPVIISEVLQTSEAGNTPQANMAGHGLTVDSTFIGKYKVYEYGVIMAIMSVMPRAMYQQGYDKQWIKRNKYEFPLPEFAHVSEKAIEGVELFALGLDKPLARTYNTMILGYQGQYDEFRFMRSTVHGEFRDSLDYWHLGRKFANMMFINRSFIECNPDSTKRIFNVRAKQGLMVSFGARIKAVRPLPSIAEPGLVDHF